jgi:hypothetical protein
MYTAGISNKDVMRNKNTKRRIRKPKKESFAFSRIFFRFIEIFFLFIKNRRDGFNSGYDEQISVIPFKHSVLLIRKRKKTSKRSCFEVRCSDVIKIGRDLPEMGRLGLDSSLPQISILPSSLLSWHWGRPSHTCFPSIHRDPLRHSNQPWDGELYS